MRRIPKTARATPSAQTNQYCTRRWLADTIAWVSAGSDPPNSANICENRGMKYVSRNTRTLLASTDRITGYTAPTYLALEVLLAGAERGDLLEHHVQESAGLAGPHHGHVDGRERPRVLAEGIGQRHAAGHLIVHRRPELAGRRFRGLAAQDAQGPAQRHARRQQIGQLPGERLRPRPCETRPVRASSPRRRGALPAAPRRPGLQALPNNLIDRRRPVRRHDLVGDLPALRIDRFVDEGCHGVSSLLSAVARRSRSRHDTATSHFLVRRLQSRQTIASNVSSFVTRRTSSTVVRPSSRCRKPSSRRLFMPCRLRHLAQLPGRGVLEDQRADLVRHRHHLEDAVPAAIARPLALPAAPPLVQHRRQLARRIAAAAGSALASRQRLLAVLGRSRAPAAAPAPLPATRPPGTARRPCPPGGSRAGGVVGVQRREDQVAGQRGLHGDLGRLAVADFADQHHVRVVAQDGAQAAWRRSGPPWW